MSKGPFHAALPAFTSIMQVSSPPGKFASWIYLHSVNSPHNTNHLSLGQNFSAAHACPLRHMFDALNRFLRHLHLKSLLKATTLLYYNFTTMRKLEQEIR